MSGILRSVPGVIWNADHPNLRAVVEDGNPADPCSRCGIRREHAGVIKETCGPFLGEDGCFVIRQERDCGENCG